MLDPFLGSCWADSNPLGSDELPGITYRSQKRLSALAALGQDSEALHTILGETRRLLDISRVDSALADLYVDVAKTRIEKVADALSDLGSGDLHSREFSRSLWWVDELFTSLAFARGLGSDALGAEGMDFGGWWPPFNMPPIATDDWLPYLVHDRPFSMPAPGAVGNDTDDGQIQPLSAYPDEGYTAQGGTYSIEASGAFTYMPPELWTGTDWFDYQITDGQYTDWGTVRMLVNNMPPVAVDDGPYYVGFLDTENPPPLIVGAPGVLSNDWDPDGDYPLSAVLYSDPSHGTLEYFNSYGSFKYVPDPGFTGNDSFQYLANDGIASSPSVGTVRVTTYRVDVMLSDGQIGAEVPYPVEESRGAFTVANKNDTDGDGVTDNVDVDGVIATPAGRGEVDLMRLKIARPYLGFEGSATLTVPSGQIVLWQESTKVNRVPLDDFGVVQFTAADFTGEEKEMWAEVFSPSASVRDMSINLSYRALTDTAKATGVWVSLAAVEHDTNAAADLLAAGTWHDMSTPPKDVLNTFGGTGLRPINAQNGVANVILMKYVIQPASNQYVAEGVFFDVTQRAQGHQWWLDASNEVVDHDSKQFDPRNEWPNDDPFNNSASNEPDSAGAMYFIDPPGTPVAPEANEQRYVMRASYETFVRMGIGADPSGDTWQGSRASDKYEWHVRHRCLNVNGQWERTTGNQQETDLNDIGPPKITPGENP